MKSKIFVYLFLCLLLSPISLSTAVMSDGGQNSTVEANSTKQMVSKWGVEFTVRYNESQSLQVIAKNPTRHHISSGFVTSVDGLDVARTHFDLSSGEAEAWNIEFAQYMDSTLDEHVLLISTVGTSVQFNFTQRVDVSENGTIPTPYISDVVVGNGIIENQPTTVVNVTIENPSPRIYPTKLMAFTEGTNGSLYVPVIYPGESETVSMELLESRGSNVAGEIRLYEGELNTRRGALDQVEFVGRADGETRHWNQSYEPVKPPWDPDNYEYENESIDTASDDDLSGVFIPVRKHIPEIVAAFGVLLLLALLKRRR